MFNLTSEISIIRFLGEYNFDVVPAI